MKDAVERVVGAIKFLLPRQAAMPYEFEKAKAQKYRSGLRNGKQGAVRERSRQ